MQGLQPIVAQERESLKPGRKPSANLLTLILTQEMDINAFPYSMPYENHIYNHALAKVNISNLIPALTMSP